MKIIKKLLIVSLICIIAFPVFGVGYMWVGCSLKMAALDSQTSDIQDKFEQSGLNVSQSLKVYTNGDCFTGSGTSFSFTIDNPIGSPNNITQEVVAKLNNSGIPAPKDISAPRYLFGQDGNVSGGGTPISQIYASYDVGNSFDTYNFTYQLPEKIPCAFDANRNEVICNGVEKKQLLMQLLDTAEVTSVEIGGSVRKPE